MMARLLLVVLLPGCTRLVDVDGYAFEENPCGEPSAPCEGGRNLTYVIVDGDAARAADGMGDGFDLDGTADPVCRQPDLVAPDGTPGIDNQVGTLIEVYERLLMVDLHQQTVDRINSGVNLQVVELANVDDLREDECVEVTVRRAFLPEGVTPEMLDDDMDGEIDPGQLFDVTLPSGFDENGCIRDGVVHGRFGRSSGFVPLQTEVEVTVTRSRVRARISEERLTAGLQGGALDVAETVDSVMRTTGADIRVYIEPLADLDPDPDRPRCRSLSYALTFEAVPARVGITRPP
jgi:hypothetical protein